MPRVSQAVHRTNWLLAALEPDDFALLEPHLELVELARGQVLYEPGDPIRHIYFPHQAVVSLVNVMDDGGTVEVAAFGRGGILGFLSALVTREAFGRYIVQMGGTASRITYERLNEVRNACPALRQVIAQFRRGPAHSYVPGSQLQRGSSGGSPLLPLDPQPARPSGRGHAAPHA